MDIAKRFKVTMKAWFFNGKDVITINEEKKDVDKKTILTQNVNMKSQSLIQHILDSVETFRQNNDSFSIYEITTRLRRLANEGKIVITDLNPTVLAGKTTYFIAHDTVRPLFLNAIRDGLIVGLHVDVNPDGYNVYSFPNTQQTTVPTTVSTALNVKNVVQRPIKGKTVYPPAFKPALLAYLSVANSGKRRFSMKQIQSRFDNLSGVSCADYVEIVTKLGYKVYKPDLRYKSQWYIVNN